MKKILRKIKAFCKRYIFKNKIISIIVGILLVGLLLFVILNKTNVDYIKRVKRVLTNKYYKVECMNDTCDYIIAYSGDKLGKSNILIYDANGKKIASYKEDFKSKEKTIKNIYGITKNYIIFEKYNIVSGKSDGYLLTTPKAKIKYSSDNKLSSINDLLISEKLDEGYNIIDKNGKVLYTGASNIKSYADGKVISMTIKNENVILNEQGTAILNGYRIAKQVKDNDSKTLYLVLQDSNKNAYYYYNINTNKIVGDSFNGYVDAYTKGELVITKKDNNHSVKYVLRKDGKRDKLDVASLENLNNIDKDKYEILYESYIIPSQKSILVYDTKNSTFGTYNIKTNKYNKLFEYKDDYKFSKISKLLTNEKELYLQISCTEENCGENKMVVYDMVNDKNLYQMINKDFTIQYLTNYGFYNVVKYSSDSSDDYKSKYAIYNKENKEIFRSDDPIVIIDQSLVFGKEYSNNSLILYSTKSKKALNSSETLANKITLGKSYFYKYSDDEKTYLYNSVGDKLKVINNSKVSLMYSLDTILYVDDNNKVFIINPTDNRTRTYKLKVNEKINTNDGENIPPYRNTLFINNTVNNNIKIVNINGRVIKNIKSSAIETVKYNKDTKNVIIITKQVRNNNNYYGLYIGK